MAWANRIVEQAMVDPRSITPNPKNFRLHPAEQQEAIDAVLKELGWIDAVTVSKRTNVILNGHLRAEQAITDGLALIPVRYVDLTEEEEDIILASFDRVSGMAKIDEVRLGRLVRDLKPKTSAVQVLAEKQARQYDALGSLKKSSELPRKTSTTGGCKVEQKLVTTVKVVIGHIQIFLPKDGFYNWLESVTAEVGESKEDLATEFAKRLGLERS